MHNIFFNVSSTSFSVKNLEKFDKPALYLYLKSFIFFLLIPALFLQSCASSSSTRFYILSSLDRHDLSNRNDNSKDEGVIGILPVKIPKYIDRSNIVTRISQNEIKFSDFHLWASSLKDAFSRVLDENLSILLRTNNIVHYPWRNNRLVNHLISVDVIRFDGKPGENVTLIARWSVFNKSKNNLVFMKKSSIDVPLTLVGYKALVEAQSNAVEQLSRLIADSIISIRKMN